MTKNYYECLQYMDARFPSVSGIDFYKYIFPNNENQGECNTDYSKPNSIYLYCDETEKFRQRIMLNDTWQADFMEYVECNKMTLCSGLTYRGKRNKLDNAQTMNALIFDLDGVGMIEIDILFRRIEVPHNTHYRTLPLPTFVVCSGQGLHLYYVLDKPIDLYPNIKLQLKALKYALTFRIWDYKATSQQKNIQYQSINQGFRMVGSVNTKYGIEVVAYQTGERIALDTLNQYVADEKQVDVLRPFRPSTMTREQAREQFPEWYERTIVQGNKQPKKWDIGYRKKTGRKDFALYEWWLNQSDKAKAGHRYFYLMCLVIYACKCDVPKDRLLDDLSDKLEDLSHITHTNQLTEEDVRSALESYDKGYYNFTIADIEKLTDIRIERNKRNYRPQAEHIKLMNFVRDELKGNKDWRNKDGRPTAETQVKEWRESHPSENKAECHRQTGLARDTIRKWWN